MTGRFQRMRSWRQPSTRRQPSGRPGFFNSKLQSLTRPRANQRFSNKGGNSSLSSHFRRLGSLLFTVAAVCLFVSTITAPIDSSLGILEVNLVEGKNALSNNARMIRFGTFGFCYADIDQTSATQCSARLLGYNPAYIMSRIDQVAYSTILSGASGYVAKGLVVHPVAFGLAAVAALTAWMSYRSSIIAMMFTGILAWMATLAAMVIDLVLFGPIRRNVNADGSGSKARYASGLWATLGAFVLLTLALFVAPIAEARRRKATRRANGSNIYGSAGTR